MNNLATKIIIILLTIYILPRGTHLDLCHMASIQFTWHIGVNVCHVPLLGLTQVITKAKPKLKPCGTQVNCRPMPLKLGLNLNHMASIKNTIFFGFNHLIKIELFFIGPSQNAIAF